MSDAIRVLAKVVGRPDKVDDLISVLKSLIEPSRAESGCRQYQLLRSTSDPTLFTFVEEWESDAAMDEHLASDHVQAAIARVPELCRNEPDIQRFKVLA